MQQQSTPAAAQLLLQWMEEIQERDVMADVMAQLSGAGLDSGLPLATAAAAPVTLAVDVTELAHSHAALATEVMANTGQLETQATALINNQLASMHPAAPGPAGDLADEPPSVRVCLQMQQVPLPLSTVPDLVHQVTANSTNSSSSSPPHLASLLAVVSGVSPPADTCHSQRFHCPSCGQHTDVPVSQHSLPCCSIPKTEWLKEDITGRLMVLMQQVWVSELSSATGRCRYSISGPSLHVHLPERLVGSCSLGDIVHIIGHASIKPVPGPSSSCAVQVEANNLQAVLPQMLWALPGPSTSSLQEQQHPLQHTWDLLTAALGYNTPLDPHVAVAMLLSAAAVGSSISASGGNGTPAGLKQLSQVNLLVLHEAFSPTTPRLLREAAALLTPQSVAMPVHQAEYVTPITGGGSSTTTDTASKAVFASLLHLTNSGIAAADLAIMTSKSKTQLLQALQAHQTPLPKDTPPGLLLPPLTATCWAAASWQEVCPSAGGEGGHVVRHTGRRGGSAAGDRTTWHGFDLCIGDGTMHEDDLWGLLDFQAASTAEEQWQLQQSQQQASVCLRQLVAGAAGCDRPVLSEAAQAFLGQYFLMVRQSVDGSSYVSKPHLLSSVVAVASAAARLHHRSTVLECPDAALAVVLMEQTLANKLGEAYHSLLDLPCDLNPSNERTLDEQLQLLHGVISRAFRQSGFAACDDEMDVEEEQGVGGGWGAAAGGGEGSDDDSGVSGGVGGGYAGADGGKDADDVVPEE